MTEREETLLHCPNVSITVLFDTVKIEMTCASDYEAQVLFDDLCERVEAGQAITIEPGRAHGEEKSDG